MDIETTSGQDEACEEFICSQPAGRACHSPRYAATISRAMGHRSFCLKAVERGQVRGVLPLTHIRSRLLGNRLVSQAFANYGGPLADCPEAMERLLDRATEMAVELGCQSIEYRSTDELPSELVCRQDKVSMLVPLTTEEEAWKRIGTKNRTHVRKAEKSGLTVQWGREELLDGFYDVWTRRMREVGTPCYPKGLFAAMFSSFPQSCWLCVVYDGLRPVAGDLVLRFGSVAEIPWGASLVEYNSRCPTHLMWWRVTQQVISAGAIWLDLGRSTIESSHYQTKKQWGAQQVDLRYQYWVKPGGKLNIVAPNNPSYRRKIRLWKACPLWLTRVVGPVIGRNLA